MARPCPAFVAAVSARGEAGEDRVHELGERERQRLGRRSAARQPLEKGLVQLGTELSPEPRRIGEKRKTVQCAGGTMTVHRFGSGSRRWARAASTWSASRRASACAVARPCAVIR